MIDMIINLIFRLHVFHMPMVIRKNYGFAIVVICSLQIFFFLLGRMSIQVTRIEQDEHIYHKLQNISNSKQHHSTYLLVIITTSPNDVLVRTTIRKTWLRLSTKTPSMFRHIFPIGFKNLSSNTSNDLYIEKREFGDIVPLHNLIDSYNKLSSKTALSISYAVENYEFKYLLKVDGDSFVRLGSLLKSLRDIEHKRLYWGFLDGRARPLRKGKWKEPEWILCDRYLPYQLGGGYVLAYSLAHYIHQNLPLLKFYRSEDVSVGAWLAGLDIKYIHDPRFDTEFTSRGCHNEYLITHKKSVNEMISLFRTIQDTGDLCNQEFRIRPSYVYDFSVPASECCRRTNGTKIP